MNLLKFMYEGNESTHYDLNKSEGSHVLFNPF